MAKSKSIDSSTKSSSQRQSQSQKHASPTLNNQNLTQLKAYRVEQKSKKEEAVARGKQLAKNLAEKKSKGQVKKIRTKTSKAGLFFNVDRILRRLKKSNNGRRVQSTSAVLLAGVLEYMTAELLELAGNIAHQHKYQKIKPRHIYLAVETDLELEKFLQGVTMSETGVVPHIHTNLLKTKANIVKDLMRKGKEHDSLPQARA
jgi:histone H2A